MVLSKALVFALAVMAAVFAVADYMDWGQTDHCSPMGECLTK